MQEIYGEADAKASAIYAKAYDSSSESAEFYQFIKTLETYRDVLSSEVSLVLTTDSPLFRLLKATSNSESGPDVGKSKWANSFVLIKRGRSSIWLSKRL